MCRCSANSAAYTIALTGLVFAAMTALWCYAAYRLVSHPALGTEIRRYGSRAVPFVLIALGVWILLQD
jgi:cadmium resistance protein CadD (predicted permease)